VSAACSYGKKFPNLLVCAAAVVAVMAQKRVVPMVALRRLRDAALVWRQAAVAAVEGVKTRHDRRLDGLVPATADGTTDSVVDAAVAGGAACGGAAQHGTERCDR
jgi:predicted MFS family arabinose efflux permease